MKRLLCLCSFVPRTLLETAGFCVLTPGDLPAGPKDPSFSNLCSAVGQIEGADLTGVDGVILTNCCNSAQRLWDRLQACRTDLFLHRMELPRTGTRAGRQRLEEETERLCTALETWFGRKIARVRPVPQEERMEGRVLVLSSMVHPSLLHRISRSLQPFQPILTDCLSFLRADRMLSGQPVSCPRMSDYVDWVEGLLDQAQEVCAVVLAGCSRCDAMLFDLPLLYQICRRREMPVLTLLEEFGPAGEGCGIRLEALRETLLLKGVTA